MKQQRTYRRSAAGGRTHVVRRLPSRDCFFVSLKDAPDRVLRDDKALAFYVEDELAADADDFSVVGWRHGAAGVCFCGSMHPDKVELDRDESDQHEQESGIDVLQDVNEFLMAVVPEALLMVEALLPTLDANTGWVRIRADDSEDWVRLDDGIVTQWFWTGGSVGVELSDAIEASMGEARENRVGFGGEGDDEGQVVGLVASSTTVGVGRGGMKDLDDDLLADVHWDEVEALDVYEQQLKALAAGKVQSRYDLQSRSEKRAGRMRLLERTIVAALVLLIVGLGSVVAAQSYQRQLIARSVQDAQDQLEEAYRAAFPNGPIPVGALSRLQSEHRRLKAMQSDSGSEPLVSVQPVWFGLLRSLPTIESSDPQQRYNVSEMAVTSDGIDRLVGTARSIATLERLYANLNQQHFDVPTQPGERRGEYWKLELRDVPFSPLPLGQTQADQTRTGLTQADQTRTESPAK